MRNYKQNQYTNKMGLKRSTLKSIILLLAILILIAAIGAAYTSTKRLNYIQWRDRNIWAAPCSNFCEQGYTGHRVYAAEPTPTIDPKWSNVVKLIVDEFEPEGPQVTYQAISVAKNESGWRHNAVGHNTNGSTDSCPFQINSIHNKRFGTKYKTDLKECIRVAHVIYREQGWRPWVAAKILGYVKS